MSKPSPKDRLRYAFDNSLSRGTAPFILWLAVASAILVLVAAVVIWLLQLLPRDSFISLSRMLAQVSQRKELSAVMADLFDSEGSKIHLRPAGNYIAPGQPVNSYTVAESARQQDEIALAYHLRDYAADATHNYGIVLSPNKYKTVTFSPEDRIIILAEA